MPSHLVTGLTARLRAWVRSGRVSPDEQRMIDLESRQLLEVCGACERIRMTPMPPALTWVTRLSVGVALIGLPLALEAELGWLIIPVAGIATFLVLVAELISHALEQPFGTEFSQLKLSVIAAVIDTTTAEILDVEPTGGSSAPSV